MVSGSFTAITRIEDSMNFKCENCGDIDHVLVDGYAYGDRLLEGVMFEVRRNDKGEYNTQVEQSAAEYFSQLNTKQWLDEINSSMDTEEFSICPKCGEEVLINEIEPKPAILKTLQSFADIIGGGAFSGAFTAGLAVEPEVGEREEKETPSDEGGELGGGGASGDVDDSSDSES